MTLTLSNGPATVDVDVERGGRLAGWRVGPHQLLLQADPARDVVHWGCFPMLPWAGRISGGRFEWEGETVQLARTDPPHALHGVGHHLSWEVVEVGEDTAVLHLDLSTAGAQELGWTFGGTARHAIAVSADAVRLSLTVRAGAEAMPLTMGWHPWFSRHLPDVEGRVEGAVAISAQQMYVRADDGVPTGRLTTPTSGPWDDCFTGLTGPSTVRWPGIGHVEVSSDLDHLVVYDMHPDGLCAEPQSGPPDQVNTDRRLVLAAGAEMSAHLTLRWVAA